MEHGDGIVFLGHALEHSVCAADPDYQNRIILQDNTLNLPVVARQPHPDPNYAPHAAAPRYRRLKNRLARHALAVVSGVVSSIEPLDFSNILRRLISFTF